MSAPESRRRRCAIYTRKSSEEGLEQDFNSLDAQREGCEAYIQSQKSEGWLLVSARYDDGGFSGGTLERPALARLLADIDAGKVDTVVVYKVDRLTRSLSDFAKIVDVLDAHSVSFVSITQQFNTTTSMGRLTLNMLLSFAQFEREVTGERIRDKIAASKRKGLWMGGLVPLGYEANGRTLDVIESEAETVRTLFQLYLELGSVRRLKEDADRRGLRSKSRVGKEERVRGNRSFSRGALYHLLSNPVYIGRIPHKEDSYEGQHPAILDRETWDAVQTQLSQQTPVRRSSASTSRRHPLAGRIFDETGRSLSATSTTKSSKRYRYYVSPDSKSSKINAPLDRSITRWHIIAHEIESTIERAMRSLFSNPLALTRLASKANVGTGLITKLLACTQHYDGDVLRFVARVDLKESQLTIHLGLSELMKEFDAILQHSVPFSIQRRGDAVRLVVADDGSWASNSRVDTALVKAIVRGRKWFEDLANGRAGSIMEIAESEGVSDRYVGALMPLAFLAPEIVKKLLTGGQPTDLTVETLRREVDLPSNWDAQCSLLRIR